ncbi:MAG: transporter substrate-binding domain-containing protein [Thermodesulfobacteriota bacterium]
MRGRAGWLLLGLVAVLWLASAAVAGQRVVAVIPRDSPPTYYQDSDGQAAGFAVEVMNLVAARAGLTVEYSFAADWAAIIAQVERGEADVIPNMGISPERRTHLEFSDPVEVFPVVFFVRTEAEWEPEGPEQRHVGVVRGSLAYEHLKARPNLILREYGGFTDGLFDLLAGKIDAFACPQPTFLKLARESGVEGRIKVAGRPITDIKRGMAVRKGNTELLAQLNTAIAGLTANPEYQQIYARWYAAPKPFWTVGRVAMAAGGGLLLAVVLMALWHYFSVLQLNRELGESMARSREAERALLLFRELVNESSDALFVIEPATSRILDANAKAWESLGYSREELLTMGIIDFETRLPDRASWQQHVAEVRKGGAATVEGFLRRKDGAFFPVEVNVRYVIHGGRDYMVAITRDITERKQAEAERERLLGEVKILSGMLPICSACKKIRDDQGYWTQVETYIHRHSQAEFTHSLCPECVKALYPQVAERVLNGKETPSSDGGN